MDNVVYRLTWFELEVCPHTFRLAAVPGQPILVGTSGPEGTLLVPYEGSEALYESILDRLQAQVTHWRILETAMHQPQRAFEDEKAYASPSLHLRIALGDATRWASMYPLQQVPANVKGLLEACQQMARELFTSVHAKPVSPEKARSTLHASEARPPAVIARVKVTRTGELFLNGRPSSLDELTAVFARLKAEKGGVWYHREDPGSEPSQEAGPVAEAVIDAIIKAQLPVKLCEEDFDSPKDEGANH